MDRNCLIGIGILSGVILGIVAMFLNYKAKFERKGVILEKNDQKHEHKHKINEERINKLEEKNGTEMRKIEKLNTEIKVLKQIIYDNQGGKRKQNKDGKG